MLVTQMQLDWSDGKNAVRLGWWQKCSWDGMVAQMKLD